MACAPLVSHLLGEDSDRVGMVSMVELSLARSCPWLQANQGQGRC